MRSPHRLAGVADQRLLDRGVVLGIFEPRHGPDRREADRRVLGVRILFEAAEAVDGQVLRKDLVADAVERIQAAESFLGVLLLRAVLGRLAGDRLS